MRLAGAGGAAATAGGSAAEASPAGPPRAHIPPMSAGADFALSGEPDRPVPQRFRFEPDPGFDFPAAPGQFAARFQQEAAAAALEPASAASLRELKPLGQVNASFIVAVNSEGLWLIDQHVAHERILFEQHLRARREGPLTGQRLLMPRVVELTPAQLAIFERIAEELRANGFDVEPIGPRSVALQAAPAAVTASDAEKLLAEILSGIETAESGQAISLETLQANIAASTACHAAIKVNTPLDQPKMEWLLAELAHTDAPMSCPHGRPVVLRYSLREIEKAFKRV